MKKLIACLMTMLLLGGGNSCFAAEEAYISFNDAQVYQEGRFGEKKESVSLLAVPGRIDAKNAIAQSMLQLRDTVNLSKYQIPPNDMNELLNDVINENPGLFFIDLVGCRGRVINGYMFSLDFSNAYRWTKEEIREKQKAIANEVSKILANIDEEKMSAAEKALYVHDWFVLHYAYDYENYKNDTLPPESFRIDGLFIDKTAVCQGYALGYMYVLEQLEIESVFVPSVPLKHAWNMVKIDDAWYHVDVTWDDPVEDMPGRVLHNNFLLSDTDIIETGHYDKINSIKDPLLIWKSPYTATESYEGFWELETNKYVLGGMFYHNGMWYYMADDDIVSYNPTNQTIAPIKADIESAWLKDENNMSVGINMAIYKGYIYYNTDQEICWMDLDEKEEHVYIEPKSENMFLYGLRIDGDILCYGYTENGGESIQFEEIELDWFSAVSGADGLKINLYNAPDAPETGQFYVAMYKENELLHFNTVTLTEEKEYKFVLPENVADRVCVYAWNGFTPIGRIKTILLNQEV